MPIVLSEQDRIVIGQVAAQLCQPEDLEESIKDLLTGFEQYASDALIIGKAYIEGEDPPQVPTQEQRDSFFQTNAKRLIANYKFAGKDSATVFTGMRQHIYNTFKRLGIPERDRDEITDAAIVKMWQFNHAEKYNPIRSAWAHHVYLALYRMSSSFYEKRQRDPVAQGFSFQQYESSQHAGEDLQLEPYELEQDLPPESKMMVAEALQDFEEFLKLQPPYRTGVVGNHKEVCTLVAPGTDAFPLTENMDVFMVRRSDNTCRVELEDGTRPLVPTSIVTNVRPNESRGLTEGKRIDRTPYGLYQLLMRSGAQVHDIALSLKVGDSTAHNWIRKLEEAFQQWWKETEHIHVTARWMARPVRICPSCGDAHLELPAKIIQLGILDDSTGVRIHRVLRDGEEVATEPIEGHWCDECMQCTLDAVENKVQLPYPWGHVRGTQELQERSARYKPKLIIQRCSL